MHFSKVIQLYQTVKNWYRFHGYMNGNSWPGEISKTTRGLDRLLMQESLLPFLFREFVVFFTTELEKTKQVYKIETVPYFSSL
jgi:hypothetical protein